MSSLLWHVFLGAEIGAADARVLVDPIVFACELRVVQATRIAECSRTIWATSPFRRFSAVAAVATSRWSSTSSAFLRVDSCIATLLVLVHFLWVLFSRGWRCFTVSLVLVPLVSRLLLVNSLLCNDDVSNLQKRVKLNSRFGNHVVHFNDARKGRHGWSRPLGLVHSISVTTGEIIQNATGGRNLVQISIRVLHFSKSNIPRSKPLPNRRNQDVA